jgi:hypothetical protein
MFMQRQNVTASWAKSRLDPAHSYWQIGYTVSAQHALGRAVNV